MTSPIVVRVNIGAGLKHRLQKLFICRQKIFGKPMQGCVAVFIRSVYVPGVGQIFP